MKIRIAGIGRMGTGIGGRLLRLGHGRRLPLVERALECFDRVSRDGLGDGDCGMVPIYFSQRDTRR